MRKIQTKLETRCFKKKESWTMVKNNIAMKDGDYPGTKNVSRFREAISNQIDFLTKGDTQYEEN